MTSLRKKNRSDSEAARLVDPFDRYDKELAEKLALTAWDSLPIEQRAALADDWSYWVRSKQRPPSGDWSSWGFLTGRGFGKTIAISKWITGEVETGNARYILLLAQDEQSCIDIQVNGKSGLIATAHPWNKPTFEGSSLRLTWPNGAEALIRTPEVPGKIRGPEYDLSWASELQSWPKSTREEALDMVLLSTRLGLARLVWDSTPKRRHPLLKELLSRHEADPSKHYVVRGTTYENAANLADSYIDEMTRKYGGTLRGREELFGEMLDDAETSIVKQAWISYRPMPSVFAYRVISIDPAVTNNKGSDTTGIVEDAIGTDGHAYAIRNASGKYDPGVWAALVLDWYAGGADLVLAETNKGGSLVMQNLRSVAKERGLEVIPVGKDEKPRAQRGKVFVKEVYARGTKADRAEPVGTAYERGRVSHIKGNPGIVELEDTLTTWEPSPNADSPGDLDAHVHAIVELLDLNNAKADPAKGFAGLQAAARQIAAPSKAPTMSSIFSSFRGGGNKDRI